jgi:ATP-binding cassette, subfamily B, bacterial HlyB/CyaB
MMQLSWEEKLAAYVKSSFEATLLATIGQNAMTYVSTLTTAMIIFYGAQAVIAGQMTVGELVAFNMIAGQVVQPILRLSQFFQDFQQIQVSVERLGDVLNAPMEVTPQNVSSPPPAKGAIEFKSVQFRYRPGTQPVLSDISLSIAPGEVVGVVGPSGSGKSTLTKLLQRLYSPDQGQVLVDGVDVAQMDPAWLRRQIGVVLQESMLFNRSIRDNIALTDPAMPMERIIAAASLAGAHEFILELAEGYDTLVGERGSTLSGGQRQRIAIARALVSDPRVLIFDEATSALDYESERVIQQNMKEIARGRTVLIIAHRLSTVRAADRIFTLERGRLIEDGTHETLIKTGGRYAALHRLQGGLHEVS